MKFKKLTPFLVGLVLISLSPASHVSAEEYSMNVQEKNVEEIIYPEEIEKLNREAYRIEGSHLTDMTADYTLTGHALREMIEIYQDPGGDDLNGAPRTPGDFDSVLSRRNLEAIPDNEDPVSVSYGVLVKNTALRSFPTWLSVTQRNEPTFDLLQETGLQIGEGVFIVHQTADTIWSYVVAEDYDGWIMTDTIGFTDKDTMTAFIDDTDFAVVTSAWTEIGGTRLRMGVKLPVSEDGQHVLFPSRDELGNLIQTEEDLNQDDWSIGFLPLTKEALLTQGEKLIGFSYGWGDSNGGMDCTSTVRAIYNCFGVLLPRNTGWMMTSSSLSSVNFDGLSHEERIAVFDTLPEGAVLLMRGHAMFYAGRDADTPKMIHNVTGYRLSPEGDNYNFYRCVLSPVDIYTRGGESYYDRFVTALVLPWDSSGK